MLLFFGCQGKKLRREILHLVRDLPSTYEDIAQRIQTLNSAVQYYVEFVAFLLSRWVCFLSSRYTPLLYDLPLICCWLIIRSQCGFRIIIPISLSCSLLQKVNKPGRVLSSVFILSLVGRDFLFFFLLWAVWFCFCFPAFFYYGCKYLCKWLSGKSHFRNGKKLWSLVKFLCGSFL